MLEFESQWQEIMEDGQYSEVVSILTPNGAELKPRGIFYSGNYKDEAPAPYAPSRSVFKEEFQLSESSIPCSAKALQNATLDRGGVSYKVLEVRGRGSGMITLLLKAVTKKEDLDE